jgi:hypothetical protein
MTRLRLSIVALLCLISTSAWADLRTYDVDFQYRNEVYSALRSLLWATTETIRVGNTYGRVELLPSGQILVNADPATLEQVDQLLRAIRARPAAATPRVTLRYWAVLGTPPGTAVTARPGSTRPPTGLQEVLTELKRFHGELQFQVLGTAVIVSESGQSGRVTGTPLSAEQTAHVQADTLNAEIRMTLAPVGRLEVRTSLKRGEFVVLGESTQQSSQQGQQGSQEGVGFDGTLFYIVHWPE